MADGGYWGAGGSAPWGGFDWNTLPSGVQRALAFAQNAGGAGGVGTVPAPDAMSPAAASLTAVPTMATTGPAPVGGGGGAGASGTWPVQDPTTQRPTARPVAPFNPSLVASPGYDPTAAANPFGGVGMGPGMDVSATHNLDPGPATITQVDPSAVPSPAAATVAATKKAPKVKPAAAATKSPFTMIAMPNQDPVSGGRGGMLSRGGATRMMSALDLSSLFGNHPNP